MDHSSHTSPSSIHVPSLTASYGAQCPPRRGSSHTSSKAGSRTAMPKPIPNTRVDFAPPPLPPPRNIEGIDEGHDPGWRWGNTGGKGGFGSNGLGSVSPGSSLRGNWGKRLVDTGRLEERRRRSPGLKYETEKDSHDFQFKDEGYHSLSGSSIAHQSVFSHLSSLLGLGVSISIRRRSYRACIDKSPVLSKKRLCRPKAHDPHSRACTVNCNV